MYNNPALSKPYILVCIFISLFVVSCNKPQEDKKTPGIAFNTTPGHVYAATTVKKDSTIIIGLEATKTGNDLLRYINVFCSYDSRPDTLLYQINFPSGTGTSYANDLYFRMRDSVGTEKYTFEANSYLGQSSSINVTLTVQ